MLMAQETAVAQIFLVYVVFVKSAAENLHLIKCNQGSDSRKCNTRQAMTVVMPVVLSH